VTLSYEWYDEGPVPGRGHSKYTSDFSPWGRDNRNPLSASIPGTISTGAPYAPANVTNGQGTSPTLGTTCQNCFAIPRGTGSPFNPINGGLGPLGPSSAPTLNWLTFNTPANSGSNGTRNVFDALNNGTGYEVAPVQ